MNKWLWFCMCSLTQPLFACPTPTGNEPFGLEEFRSGTYRIYFCQSIKPEEQKHTLTAAEIGNIKPLNPDGSSVGGVFSDKGIYSAELPLSSAAATITGSIDLSGLEINSGKVTLESESFHFYSRSTRPFGCSALFDGDREYKYIVGYLKGISTYGAPPSSPGEIFSATWDGGSKMAVIDGSSINIANNAPIAKIENVRLTHLSSGQDIPANIYFVVGSKQEYDMGWGTSVCRVGVKTKVEIMPASSINIDSPGDYSLTVSVHNPSQP